jgi:hypothetical protein
MSEGEHQLLIGYMPIVVRSSTVTDWERTFCASIIHKARSSRFTPTEKQIGVMRRIVAKFQDECMRDEPLTEDSHDER